MTDGLTTCYLVTLGPKAHWLCCVVAALPVDFHFNTHVNRLELALCQRGTRVSKINEKKTGDAHATQPV